MNLWWIKLTCKIVWGLRLSTSLVMSPLVVTLSLPTSSYWLGRKGARIPRKSLLWIIACLCVFLLFSLLNICLRVTHLLLKNCLEDWIYFLENQNDLFPSPSWITIESIFYLLRFRSSMFISSLLITWVLPIICSKVKKQRSGLIPVVHHASLRVCKHMCTSAH